jgi:hypothetical protein
MVAGSEIVAVNVTESPKVSVVGVMAADSMTGADSLRGPNSSSQDAMVITSAPAMMKNLTIEFMFISFFMFTKQN